MHDCSCIVARAGTVSDFVSLDRSRCATRGMPSAFKQQRNGSVTILMRGRVIHSGLAVPLLLCLQQAVSRTVSQHSLSCYHRLSNLPCVPSLFF